jgi:PTH2 family peptidyl-tRNA hydrolase
MSEPKQVIVMRKDLNMRKGKMVAQGAHASMKVLLDLMYEMKSSDMLNQGPAVSRTFATLQDSPVNHWLTGRFTKICVSVDSEVQLLEIVGKAKDAGLLHALITDAGLTEFDGVPTRTCAAIGPADPEDIDKITGHLKLL